MGKEDDFLKKNLSLGDVILKTFCSMTEPDRFGIFTGWSTGSDNDMIKAYV